MLGGGGIQVLVALLYTNKVGSRDVAALVSIMNPGKAVDFLIPERVLAKIRYVNCHCERSV